MHISYATIEDTEAIVSLLNSAYRGEPSWQGWTTEAHLIAGDVRTDETSVQNVLQTNGSVILKCCDEAGKIVGTVNLQQLGSKIYLGMFAVSPQLQGKGIGKPLCNKRRLERSSHQINFELQNRIVHY